MKIAFNLIYSKTTFQNPFGYDFGRARCKPVSDHSCVNGAIESAWFNTQTDLELELNRKYWMFFGTEENQQKLKSFFKRAGKLRKSAETIGKVEELFSFDVIQK